jgi:hypothetical protein
MPVATATPSGVTVRAVGAGPVPNATPSGVTVCAVGATPTPVATPGVGVSEPPVVAVAGTTCRDGEPSDPGAAERRSERTGPLVSPYVKSIAYKPVGSIVIVYVPLTV